MFRKCSTRDYAGAIEETIEGYGTAKSCASRHFQQASSKQLQVRWHRKQSHLNNKKNNSHHYHPMGD
jgi:hypothetical protein